MTYVIVRYWQYREQRPKQETHHFYDLQYCGFDVTLISYICSQSRVLHQKTLESAETKRWGLVFLKLIEEGSIRG